MRKDKNVRDMVFTAIMAALICIAAPITLPIGAIPVSFGIFAVCLAGGTLGAKHGTAAVAVYILIGAIGLPVFTGFCGGVAKLLGLTGGYIIGYIPCALLSGLIRDKTNKRWALPLGMTLGVAACYFFGTVWFALSAAKGDLTSNLWSAILTCVVPFVAIDALKIAAASALSALLRTKLGIYTD